MPRQRSRIRLNRGWTYRSVRYGVPRVVDPNPPGRQRLIRWMGDNVRRIGEPLLDLIDKRYRKIVMQWKAGDKLFFITDLAFV